MKQLSDTTPYYSLQRDIDKITHLKNSISTPSYESYRKDAETFRKSVEKLSDELNIHRKDFESISKTLEQMKLPSPLELSYGIPISKRLFDEINDELYNTEWDDIKKESTISQFEIDNIAIDFVTKEPEEFALNLYNHVEELEDVELSSVFTKNFLNELTKSWWILPKISFEEYKELSQLSVDDKDLNKFILADYILNPKLIYDLIDNWEFHDENRAKIIMQATNDYYEGNYEICVLTLLLQIEGLMRDKLESKSKAPKLREKLERRLDNCLREKVEDLSSWEIFLIKSCKSYIWMILKPLCDEVNFIEDEYEINRNISVHNGKVEADQIVAIRLFLIIDTLMFLLDII